jgi:hypothetical protein
LRPCRFGRKSGTDKRRPYLLTVGFRLSRIIELRNHEWTRMNTNAEEVEESLGPIVCITVWCSDPILHPNSISFVSIRVHSWLNGIFPAEGG